MKILKQNQMPTMIKIIEEFQGLSKEQRREILKVLITMSK